MSSSNTNDFFLKFLTNQKQINLNLTNFICGSIGQGEFLFLWSLMWIVFRVFNIYIFRFCTFQSQYISSVSSLPDKSSLPNKKYWWTFCWIFLEILLNVTKILPCVRYYCMLWRKILLCKLLNLKYFFSYTIFSQLFLNY